MTPERFNAITGQYGKLSIAVVGDFCLDRYLEIDPTRQEISIETGLPVHNVVNVRTQPGGAGTILNNLSALGVGKIFPLGFAGEDGEGYELRRSLASRSGVQLDYFLTTQDRRTFTYCKPLLVEPGKTPRELNRLDQKNWTPTPASVSEALGAAAMSLAEKVNAMALLSQVDQPETGVLTTQVLETFKTIRRAKPKQLILADSRHSLRGFPPVAFKMNAAELAAFTGMSSASEVSVISAAALELARRNGQPVFVTLAERGIVGALPNGMTDHITSLPLRGEIDIVGAGDSVTANLTVALGAGATLREAIELANAAASIVIHQLGTTGTASVEQIRPLVSS